MFHVSLCLTPRLALALHHHDAHVLEVTILTGIPSGVCLPSSVIADPYSAWNYGIPRYYRLMVLWSVTAQWSDRDLPTSSSSTP